MNNNKIFPRNVLAISAIFLIFQAACNAAVLNVTSDKDITLVIEPGKGSMVMPDNDAIKLKVKAGIKQEIKVEKGKFGDIFSVTGKGTVPSLNNKCESLSTDKDYDINFVATKTGGIECNYNAR